MRRYATRTQTQKRIQTQESQTRRIYKDRQRSKKQRYRAHARQWYTRYRRVTTRNSSLRSHRLRKARS